MGRPAQTPPPVPVEYVQQCFAVRQDGQLIWRERPRDHFPHRVEDHANFNVRFAGKPASYRDHDIATTDLVIDDTMVGQIIGPADGFLASLVVTTPPPKYEVAEWDEGRRCWRRGYFVLRGSGDFRDLFCANPSQWGYFEQELGAKPESRLSRQFGGGLHSEGQRVVVDLERCSVRQVGQLAHRVCRCVQPASARACEAIGLCRRARFRFLISTAPRRPIAPRRLLRLAYSGPPIVKSPAEVLAIIRQRTADILTDAEIALVVRLPALEGPKPQPATKPKRRRSRIKGPRRAVP
jgi:hypothetical protein